MVSGSNPLAATNKYKQATVEQGISYFLLDCRVRGLSQGTLDCYSGKLKDFHRFISGGYVVDVTTEGIRESLAGLRDGVRIA